MGLPPPLVPDPSTHIKLAKTPPFWRDLTAPSGLSSLVQRRDWLLVLSARNIPWYISRSRGIEHLYVPPLLERIALLELVAYLHENVNQTKKRRFQKFRLAYLSLLIFIPLVIWHALRKGLINYPAILPDASQWLSLGELDKIRISIYHEYYRAVTSLTLHQDAGHLLGNLFFGGIFLLILSRLIGPGRAIFFTIVGGVCGNLLSVFIHTGAYLSIGFSTALFSTLGSIGGVMIWRAPDKRRLLLAAGGTIGLLALLGTEGENTDYAAHVCGLLCGLVCGLYEGWRQNEEMESSSQLILPFFALIIPVIAWMCAFGYVKI